MTTKSEFDKLLGDLDDILAKAQPVEMLPEPEPGADTDQDDPKKAATPAKGEADDDDDDMMKSFQVTLEDGREVEAYDATQMMKAMHTQSRRQASTLATLQADLTAARAVITKQTDLLKSLAERIGEQGTILKALREQPAGRRSAGAHAAAPAAPALNAEDVLAKALVAQGEGRLSAMDVSEIEARLAGGHALKPHHIAAVKAA